MEANNDMRIYRVGDDSTVSYAADELARYLSAMTGSEIVVEATDSAGETGISVGLITDFPRLDAPEVTDPQLDDAVLIDARDGSGLIAGNNPRSVVFAVYRYLEELGCRWVRPGIDGEYIPRIDSLPPVMLSETASYRHRGICIEGAVSCEHVKDIIDWMTKLGFNSYFTQFRESYTFFDRWYSHKENLSMEGRKIGVEEARQYLSEIVDEIGKRGLQYHAVGHGWTCEPFGISGLAWETNDQEIPDSARVYLAEINGERKLWNDIPLNTNLCYGNPEARRIIIEDIADYLEKHTDIDILHFWLADGFNNHCECVSCRDTRPSDFYVQMLNELDELLTARNLQVRIAYLIYVDLLWPPVAEKINNPDRFILMFAPITRSYSSPLSAGEDSVSSHPFERNNLTMPRSVEENVAFLQAWQNIFSGDSFDFDYHLMWDHYFDPGHMSVSNLINQDAKALKKLGLNGFISCQTQRVFFPLGLPMVVLGRTLWNNSLNFDSIADDYFQSGFGPESTLCREYLKTLTELFDPVYLRGEKPIVSTEAAERFRHAKQIIRDFHPVIDRNADNSNYCWSKSWFYLKHHSEIYSLLAEALEARARGDVEEATGSWEAVKQLARERECELHPVLDLWLFISVLSGLFQRLN